MKKILSSLSVLAITFASAQTILNENFEAYPVGNVGTAVDGNTAGVGGWYPYNGTAADHQIAVIDAAHGKSLRLSSGNVGVPAGHRLDFKDVSTVDPTPGNEIIQATFEIYTGPATTGAGKVGLQIWDYTASTSGTGITGAYYDFNTKKIGGYMQLTNNATGTAGFYSIGLNTATYPANTWIPVTVRYDSATGGCTWITPDGTFVFTNANYSPTPGLRADEIDALNFVSTTTPVNTQVNTGALDNLNIIYTNVNALGTVENVKSAHVFGIYPNPATDFVTIDTDAKITGVQVYDMSGRAVKVSVDGNKVNVQALTPGQYMIKVRSAEGEFVEKFIKK